MLEHHSTMLNLTARIAVQMQNLPPWDVDWTDSRPQRHRSSLTCADFLPDEEDAAELHKRAVLYTMEVLVTDFKSLSSLKHLVPSRQSPHRLQKSVAVPMKVLFSDEKQKDQAVLWYCHMTITWYCHRVIVLCPDPTLSRGKGSGDH